MTPEAKVKNKVKKILDSLGCYHFSPQTGGYGKSGIPDIIACYKGRFIAIECKAGKGQVTALQKYNIDQIKANQGLAIIINEGNIETLLALVKEIE
jgi:Holliday junction resolvase